MEASRFPSSPEVDPQRKRIVEEDYVPDCKTYILDVTLVTGKERDMFKNILVHLRFGQRLVLTVGLCEDVILQARAARQGHLASLRSPFLTILGGSPFLTMG